MKSRFHISGSNTGFFNDNGISILIIFLASIAYFFPYLNSEKTLIPYDLLTFFAPWKSLEADPPQNMAVADVIRLYVPWRTLYSNALLSGEIPFWNPYNFSGVPLMANGISQVFYPLALINVLVRGEIGFTLFLFLHQAVTGLGMYFLLRRFGLQPPSATAGSLTWMLCGYLTVWSGWFSVLATLTWLPWLLLATDWVFGYGHKKAIGALALMVGLTLFAGHPNYAYFNFLLVGAYAAFRLVTDKSPMASRIKRFAFYILALSIGVFLAAIQVFPLVEYAGLSPRGPISIELLLGSALPLPHLITLLLPSYFGDMNLYWGAGNYVECVGYVGIAGIILSLTCFLHPTIFKRKTLLFFLFMAVIALHLVTGGWLNRPLSLVPGYTSFRALQRILSIWSFCAAALTAWGIEAILQSNSWRRISLAITSALLVAGSLIALWNFAGLSNFLAEQFGLQEDIIGQLPWPLLMLSLMGLASLLVIFTSGFKHPWLRIFAFSPSLIIVFDLITFARAYLPFVSSSVTYPMTPGISYLIENRDEGRLMRFGGSPLESPLMPNTGIIYGLEDIDGIDSFSLSSYNKLASLAEEERYAYAASYNTLGNFRNIDSLNSPVLDLIGAEFLLSEELLPDKSAHQGECDQAVGEVLAGEEVGQTFFVGADGLFRVDLNLATFARANQGHVEIVLRESPASQTVIASRVIDVSEIPDNQYLQFSFPPILDSAQRGFYIGLRSQDGRPGNSITMWSNSHDQYQGGNLWRNGVAIDGDLCFRAFSNEAADGWALAYSGSDMAIYRNKQVLPLAFIVGEIIVMPNEGAQIEALASREFDPSRHAILLESRDFQTDVNATGEVRILERTLNELIMWVNVQSSLNRGALLVIRQNHYPGWLAWVDGEQAEILTVNMTYQGLFLSNGIHEIRMRFMPRAFPYEAALSVLSLLVILFLLFLPNEKGSLKHRIEYF